ncbi:MAG: hypothetical protein ACPG6P_10965 [Akkermansiaceae bacterium]
MISAALRKKTLILTSLVLLVLLGGAVWLKWVDGSSVAPPDREQNYPSADVLEPSDLGIKKSVFKVQPGKNEVALLHCKMMFDGKLVRQSFDYFYTGGEVHYQTVLVINKHILAPMGTPRRGEPALCDNIMIQAGYFIVEFDHLYFQRSSITQSSFQFAAGKRQLLEGKNSAEMTYNTSYKGTGKELKITMEMTAIPYSKAKKSYADLPEIKAGETWQSRRVSFGPGAEVYYSSEEQ